MDGGAVASTPGRVGLVDLEARLEAQEVDEMQRFRASAQAEHEMEDARDPLQNPAIVMAILALRDLRA